MPKKGQIIQPLLHAKHCFNYQKYGAKKRKIDFNLTFEQWYKWFLDQGVDRNIPQKNKGSSWAMCRKNDQGPYELGNIYLATMSQNSSDAHTHSKIKYKVGDEHQNSKKIITPVGTFNSKAEACKHYNVTPPTMGQWLKNKSKEFYYQK
jgi:hypothetical protein